MTVLVIHIRGEIYFANEQGQFIRTDQPMRFHDSWKILGGMHHHFCTHVSRKFAWAWSEPHILVGCLLVDQDHGTTRVWAGSYHGKLPRITACYKKEVDDSQYASIQSRN